MTFASVPPGIAENGDRHPYHDSGCGPVRVTQVRKGRDWKRFHRLPGRIQGADPNWIAPLRHEQRKLWSSNHPFFEHARAAAWLAWRSGRPVGRISAQFDSLAGPDFGHFGQLEAVDDVEVFQALISTASKWLHDLGCTQMFGPFDLSINQQCGLLVDGFERPPMMLMGHAPRYYGERLAQIGLAPAVDLLAYVGRPHFRIPGAMERLLNRYAGRIEFETVTASSIARQAETLRSLFNRAWAGNWGFVPFTEREFSRMAREMRALLRPGYVHLARVEGAPAAFIVMLPNLNEWIADLDGTLLPFGWLRLAWRLLRGRVRTARVPLMGVDPAFQKGPLGAALSYGLIDRLHPAALADQLELVEMSWILEENHGMIALLESLGMKCDKRYRIYARSTV